MNARERAAAALREWRGGSSVGDTRLDELVREACVAAALEEREAIVVRIIIDAQSSFGIVGDVLRDLAGAIRERGEP